MSGYEQVQGQFEPCGDHAGQWESSLLMYLDSGMQDMSVLPENESDLIGVSPDGVSKSNPEFGKKAVEAIIEKVKIRVNNFLENHEQFQGHGSPM